MSVCNRFIPSGAIFRIGTSSRFADPEKLNATALEDVTCNNYRCEGHYNTQHADTETMGRERESDCTGAPHTPPITWGRCLPEVREAPEVDNQVEANQLLIVDSVSLDVHRKLAYVTVSRRCVSGDSIDVPGGISLGKSATCSIT